MSDERWNDDIAYAFSIHRTFLKICGLWPLQTKTIYTRIRWTLSITLMIMMLPFLIVEMTESKQNTGASNIETILFMSSTILGIVKNAYIALAQEKLNVNLEAALDDWLDAKNDEKTRTIMKKYAFKTRIVTLVLLYSAIGCLCAYISVTVAINLRQTFFTDPNSMDANINTTNWIFLIPSGSFGASLSGWYFPVILVVQIIQSCMMCITQCIVDTFYFNVTLHLAGQLEVLKNKFETFANKPDTEANCRRRFVGLVNRHSELMEYYQNLEDTFHLILLSQLTVITILLALLGLRLSICLNEHNYVEFLKSSLVLNYLFTQSLMSTYSGDFLQKESENIFHALYATSWFTLPVALMKDLHFAMMRSTIPFRLTGGKFFYINRETMMYILKTAASYVSVLRIALKD